MPFIRSCMTLRTFTHSPEALVAVAEAGGMRREYAHRGRLWQVVGLTRAVAPVP